VAWRLLEVPSARAAAGFYQTTFDHARALAQPSKLPVVAVQAAAVLAA